MVLERFDQPVDVVPQRWIPISTAKFTSSWKARRRRRWPRAWASEWSSSASEFQRLKPDVVLADRRSLRSPGGRHCRGLHEHYASSTCKGARSADRSTRVRGMHHQVLAHFHFPRRTAPAEYLAADGRAPRYDSGHRLPAAAISPRRSTARSTPTRSTPAAAGVDDRRHDRFCLVRVSSDHDRIRRRAPADGSAVGGARSAADANRAFVAQHRRRQPTTSARPSACYREDRKPNWLRTLTNLTPENYLKVLANAACAMGNSSSFVRDAELLRHAGRFGRATARRAANTTST